MRFDAAIVGGGVAGLQAALTLARARRSVLLIDAGVPRHRFAATMHNFIGADGMTPAAFYAAAREQLAAYPEVTFVQSAVQTAQPAADGFTIGTAEARYEARMLLFACGVRDILPEIDGIAALWGRTVLHCGYCHGYEARDRRLAVLTAPEGAGAMVESLWPLSPKLQFFFGGTAPSAELQDWLSTRGMGVVVGHPVRIQEQQDGLRLTMPDGQEHGCDAVFLTPKNEASTTLPFEMGCARHHGSFIAVDAWGRTSVAGIYAAGDVAGMDYHQFAAAAKSGMNAAIAMHAELTQASLR